MQRQLFVLLEIYSKDQFFEKSDGIWIDVLSTITKQYNNRIHTSTSLTPIQASLKKKRRVCLQKFIRQRKKIIPRVQVKDLVRVADLRRTFSKKDTTNWSHKLYEIKEINIDTITTYHIDNLKER